jgi:hypothetical protein
LLKGDRESERGRERNPKRENLRRGERLLDGRGNQRRI